MTKAQRNKQELREHLEGELGLEADRWGHYRFKAEGSSYRLKLTKQVVRIESKAGPNASYGWMRLYSTHYGKLDIAKFDARLRQLGY